MGREKLQFTKNLLAFCLFIFSSATAYAAQTWAGVTCLALQISDNDSATMNKVLNAAANFVRMQSKKGNMFNIGIVAFYAGLHMLREDTSPVMKRVKSFSSSIPDLRLNACQNTINGLMKKEGEAPPLVQSAVVAPGGVGRLLKLDDGGYFVIRP